MEASAFPAPANLPRPRNLALAGVLIGTAVGDALGLPMEGLSARRQRRLFPGPLRHRLLGPWGMISDDTEHTLLLAQALLESPHDSTAFQRSLARRLRWWLGGLPAGVGFATLRAILRLWIGVPPNRSGVMSAGNGAAMRSALLGVYFAEDTAARREFVQASTEITHRDPRASIAALAVAETAAWMAGSCDDTPTFIGALNGLSDHAGWSTIVDELHAAVDLRLPVSTFAKQVGAIHAVSGYAFQSVPVAIYAALRNRTDFSTALSDAIACDGDTDTVAAITGALVGARVGVSGMPQTWREKIVDYPHTLELLQRIAERLGRQIETRTAIGPADYFWPAVPLRNLVFLGIVLTHGLRRLIPPY